MRVPPTAAPARPAWRTPQAGLLLVVLFWAGNFSALKLTFREVEPLALTAVRFLIGTVVMALLTWRLEGSLALPRRLVGPMVVLGLLGNTAYQLAFMMGLSRTTATNSSLILAAMPVVVTLAAGALGIESVTRRQRQAVLVASVGVVVVLAARGLQATGQGSVLGDVLMVLAVLLWTAYTLYLRRTDLAGVSSLRMTVWTLFTGTPGLLLAAGPAMLRVNWPTVSAGAWAGILYSALLSLVAAYVLFNSAIRALGASATVVWTCLTPLFAAAIAVLALGERPTPFHLVGGAMIVTGVLLGRAPKPAPAAPPVPDAAGACTRD